MSGSEDFRSADQVSVTAAEAKAPSNALGEVIDFCSQTVQHPEARLRQTGTVLQGIVVGGIKDIPNELVNHPLETCGKVVVAGTLGAAAGAAIALEIPLVTGITIGAGVTMLGVGVIDSFKRMSSDKQLQGALSSVWKDSDFYTQMQAKDTAEKVLGPEAFNWGVTLPAGLAGGIGGNVATKMVAAKLLTGKPSAVPVDTPEVITIPAETTVTKPTGTGAEQTASSGNPANTSSLESSSPKHSQQGGGDKTSKIQSKEADSSNKDQATTVQPSEHYTSRYHGTVPEPDIAVVNAEGKVVNHIKNQKNSAIDTPEIVPTANAPAEPWDASSTGIFGNKAVAPSHQQQQRTFQAMKERAEKMQSQKEQTAPSQTEVESGPESGGKAHASPWMPKNETGESWDATTAGILGNRKAVAEQEKAAEKDLPVDPLIPNKETIEAIEAARRGELTSVSIGDLFSDKQTTTDGKVAPTAEDELAIFIKYFASDKFIEDFKNDFPDAHKLIFKDQD